MNERAYLAALGQAVVENTAVPAAPNAGRVLELAEAWRITDVPGQFFFQYPSEIQIAEDGSIFIVDKD